MRRFWICDWADALRLPETGFFRNLSRATKYFQNKPGFSPLIGLHDIIEKKLFTKGLTNWGELGNVIKSSERDAAHQT
ncbi:hypothetical protein C7B69_03650 [filamentous cyanobacterium Phorm 46]|nr:hypothetical protein C7B69_03650 [filamentous cyanobacterium Phorm 46]